jgi:hypothetical protein
MSALSNKGNSNIRVEISPAAQAIVAHALETFGSEAKAWMWLERRMPYWEVLLRFKSCRPIQRTTNSSKTS